MQRVKNSSETQTTAAQPPTPPPKRRFPKGKKLWIAVLLLGIILATGAAYAYESQIAPRMKPMQEVLPSTFTAKKIPNTNLDGYFYINLGETFKFTIPSLSPGSLEVEVIDVAFWIVPSDTSEVFGLSIGFASSSMANLIAGYIPDEEGLWKKVVDNDLFLVYGAGSGASALKDSIRSGDFVGFEARYPQVYKTMTQLPLLPSDKAIVLGFISITQKMENYVIAQSQAWGYPSAADYLNYLKTAKIEHAVFSVYLQKDVKLSEFSISDIPKFGALIIAKSSYPGFALQTVLASGVLPKAFTKTQIDGKSAYYMEVEGTHIFLAAKGFFEGYILLTISKERTKAEALMKHTLD